MDLAVDADLADAARDQLRELRAEVEDQDLGVAMDVRLGWTLVRSGLRDARVAIHSTR